MLEPEIRPDRILLIEDERALCDVLATYLRDEGFAVSEAHDGISGLERALGERPDLLVLDLNLPGLHGTELFRRVRAVYDVPVIMLTSRVNEVDRVVGLEMGADDYIGKPFSPREVVARVKTILRRSRRTSYGSPLAAATLQRIGAIEIDRFAHEVRVYGKAVTLTPTEFKILDALVRHLGQVLSREQLLDFVGSDAEMYDRTLDRHVGNLRHKIEENPAQPAHLMTVRGVGYKMID